MLPFLPLNRSTFIIPITPYATILSESRRKIHLLQKLTTYCIKKICLYKQLRLSKDWTNIATTKELEELDALDAIERSFLLVKEEFGIKIPEQTFQFYNILKMLPTS